MLTNGVEAIKELQCYVKNKCGGANVVKIALTENSNKSKISVMLCFGIAKRF